MLSGEASGAYPINNCQVSSKYMQNITLSDATGKGKESKFTIKAYLLDDKGKEIAKDTQTFEKNLVDNPYSTEVTFSNVKQLDKMCIRDSIGTFCNIINTICTPGTLFKCFKLIGIPS